MATVPGFRVKAQPMVKDEQVGAWLPFKKHDKDPLSIITLEVCDGQYEIVAHRLADSKEILRCAITADILYHKPTQSFHHWSTSGGTHRHGLTFCNFSAASKFQQQMQRIMAQFTASSSDDISADCTEARETAVKPMGAQSGQLPPKRPSKPLSLLSTEEKPPETPPPRLPSRTVTPPAHLVANSRSSVSKLPPRSHSADIEAQADTPLLPPRPGSTSHSPPHPAVAAHTSVTSHRPHHVQATHAVRQQPPPAHIHTVSSAARYRTHQQEKYSDYREYELTPISKPTAVVAGHRVTEQVERASTSSTVSSLSNSDSVFSDSRSIPLPTKKRNRNPSCLKDTSVPTERLLCKVCNSSYYERDNVRGACRSRHEVSDSPPALNCCLRRCTSDTGSRCCRRRSTLLCILMPCIWCYKRCRQCSGQGNVDYCCGSRHTPVRSKDSPS